MNNQAPQTSTPSSLDPQLVDLAKSLRQTESQGNFHAKGASGEYGAYQFLPSTWNETAPKYGVSVPLEQATPEQQNEVAYKQLAEWKQEHPDWDVGNFASAWNAGPGKPNAYKENYKGVNDKGVAYDTPAYAKKVAEAYQQFKAQRLASGGIQAPSQPGGQSQTDSTQSGGYAPPKPPTPTTVNSLNQAQAPQESFMGDISQGNYGGALAQGAKGLFNFAFPVVGDVSDIMSGKSTKTPIQIAADAALSALPFIPFLGEAGEAIRGAGLAGQVGLGAAAGGLQGISQGQDVGGVLKSAALGGATGGALEGAGNLIGKLSTALPQSIIRKYIPGLSAEEAAHAATRPLGSLQSMATESDSNLSKAGSALGAVLKNPQYEYVQPSGEEILQSVIQNPTLKDAALTPAEVAANLNKIVPLKKNLVAKLASGQDMTLTELHTLNSALGRATFKRVFDDPTVRAGKDIGSVVYHAIGDTIKKSAPESVPLFDEYSKELALNSGLKKALRSADKARPIGLREIVAMMAGLGAGAPFGMSAAGGIGAVALEKALRSPTVNLKAAGLLSKLRAPLVSQMAQSTKPLITRGVSGLVGGTAPGQ